MAERSPPPNPPQGGGATNKGQPPEKESRKNKNALTQGRTGRFTAILDHLYFTYKIKQLTPPNPPQGGGATNKGQPPEKESRKNKNALTQGRTGTGLQPFWVL